MPVPTDKGSYFPADNAPARTGLRPLDIVQPEGPSFTVDGHAIDWQRWSLRVSMDPYEGLVLHTVGYEDGGRVRPILHRAVVSEMVVPYGDPGPLHGWKNAFDAGEWGLGRMANSLALGCDCLGEIRYLDAVFADEHGQAVDDHQRHLHPRGGLRDPLEALGHARRHDGGAAIAPSRGQLDRDGRELRVRLLLVLLPRRLDAARGEAHRDHVDDGRSTPPADEPSHGNVIAPGLAAPYHQHLFCVRLDMDVDGPVNEVYEVDVVADPAGDDNPMGNAFRPHATRLDNERDAQRVVDPDAQPHVEDREPERSQRARPAGRVQARARLDADAARRPVLVRRSPRRVRHPQPVGHAVRADERRAAGPHPEPVDRWGRAAAVDGGRPVARRHRRRALVHVRRHARRRAPRTGR